MQTCSTCGASRHRVGVLYPARLLCRCEARTCSCGKPARVVEFQAPVRGDEPSLPSEANAVASFMCAAHRPSDFPLEAEPKSTKKGPPHVDPAWSYPKLPAGTTSRLKVQCVGCKNVHMMRDRRMFNGTASDCPKCGEQVTVSADEEEECA